jgi:hypothetical protein
MQREIIPNFRNAFENNALLPNVFFVFILLSINNIPLSDCPYYIKYHSGLSVVLFLYYDLYDKPIVITDKDPSLLHVDAIDHTPLSLKFSIQTEGYLLVST